MINPQFICNFVIVILAFMGLFLGFNNINSLLYFTSLSNILMMLICLVIIALNILKKKISKIIYIIKYVFTVAITITAIIYICVLGPMNLAYYEFNKVYNTSSIFLHLLVPIFSIISYLFFDENIDKRFNIYGIIIPLFYFIFVSILSISNNYYFTFFNEPSKFPYFFMDYTNNGFFTISSLTKMGVFYWYIIIIAFTIIISNLLYILKIVLEKRKV